MSDLPDRCGFAEASAYLGVSIPTLRYWRLHGTGPRSYIRMKGRRPSVCYDRADLEAFKTAGEVPTRVRGEIAASGF